MAHIVCVTGGLTSLFNASLALIQQLREAGHHVTYASPKDLSAQLSALNITFVQLAPWENPPAEPAGGRWEKLRRLRSRQQQAIAALGVEQFSPTLQTLKPDLLLIDIEMHPHIMAAVTAKVPVALLCPFISIWRRPGIPPIHTRTLPGQGKRGSQWAIQLSWWRYGWRKWTESWRDRWQQMGCDRQSILHCYAQQIGYPFRSLGPFAGFNQWLVPYPHKALPILCLHGAELDFPHESHPTMHHVGPMVVEEPIATQLSKTNNPEDELTLKRLWARRNADKNRPLIYCGCSSMLRTKPWFLKQLIATAQQSPQWDFALGLGGYELPQKLKPLPENLFVFQWAPQLALLEKANCAIVNAGAQSLSECIHFGVPMLTYSLKVNDQEGNAARVIYHKLGIVSEFKGKNAAQIQANLQKLLNDTSYRNRVEKMRSRLQHYRKNKAAAQIVESLLKQSNSSQAEANHSKESSS